MSYRMFGVALVAALATAAWVRPAAALDAYQDRRGLFAGVGLQGGAVFQGDDSGAAAGLALQLGGGASEMVTLALDIEFDFQLLDGSENWMVIPGPQLELFLWEGLFLRAGAGLAFTFVDEGELDDVPTGGEQVDSADFTMGFDGALGIGYELFAGASLAINLAVEADYIVLADHENVTEIGFGLGLRYY